MKNNAGYTLVEVIVCVAVISLLSYITYPSVGNFRKGLQLRATVMDVSADLQWAKLEAIKENNYVVVQLTSDGYTIFVDNGKGGGKPADWVRHEDERIIVERKIQGDIDLSSSFPSDHLRFSGTAGIRPGTIRLTAKDTRSVNIVLSRAGRIRIDKQS